MAGLSCRFECKLYTWLNNNNNGDGDLKVSPRKWRTRRREKVSSLLDISVTASQSFLARKCEAARNEGPFGSGYEEMIPLLVGIKDDERMTHIFSVFLPFGNKDALNSIASNFSRGGEKKEGGFLANLK